MKIYRLIKYCKVEGSEGFEFWSSVRLAKAAKSKYERERATHKNETTQIQKFEVGNTKRQILNLLNRVASHNDNG